MYVVCQHSCTANKLSHRHFHVHVRTRSTKFYMRTHRPSNLAHTLTHTTVRVHTKTSVTHTHTHTHFGQILKPTIGQPLCECAAGSWGCESAKREVFNVFSAFVIVFVFAFVYVLTVIRLWSVRVLYTDILHSPPPLELSLIVHVEILWRSQFPTPMLLCAKYVHVDMRVCTCVCSVG